MSGGPLRGIRIVDFTANMSGPLATMILGDQGADVIKVEPLAGDMLRGIGTGSGDVTAYFGNLNRSKRSLALDLAQPGARRVVDELIRGADVVVHNFRPRVADKLGLGPVAVRSVNPTVVYAAINGYGTDGPYGGHPAYDHAVQALSGFAARQDAEGDGANASMIKQGIIDKITGQSAAQAITAALVGRATTGAGRDLEIRMLDVAVAVLWPDGMMNHTLLEPEYVQPEIAHTFRLTETLDGHIAFIMVTAARMKRLATALGIPGAADLPSSGPMRIGGAIVKSASNTISAMTTSAAVDLLQSLEIPVAPVVRLGELHAHPQVVACGSVDEFEHPVMGRVRQANPAVRFDGERAGTLRPAPSIGQHSDEILREAGLSDAEVAELRRAGVIGGARVAALSGPVSRE